MQEETLNEKNKLEGAIDWFYNFEQKSDWKLNLKSFFWSVSPNTPKLKDVAKLWWKNLEKDAEPEKNQSQLEARGLVILGCCHGLEFGW